MHKNYIFLQKRQKQLSSTVLNILIINALTNQILNSGILLLEYCHAAELKKEK